MRPVPVVRVPSRHYGTENAFDASPDEFEIECHDTLDLIAKAREGLPIAMDTDLYDA